MKNIHAKINQKGAVALVLMIIISAVVLTLALSMGLSSITENQISLYQGISARTLVNTDGCAEEALVRLNRDNLYTGESITINSTSCTIVVSGTGPNRTATITATNDVYARTIQMTIVIFPVFTVTDWVELTT